jgi:hypothetical protein
MILSVESGPEAENYRWDAENAELRGEEKIKSAKHQRYIN